MLQLCLIGGLNLWLTFLSSSSGCRRCAFVCLSLCRCSCGPLICLGFFGVLLHVRLRVPVHVETIGAVGLEEELFEVVLELGLGDRGEKGNLLLLPIEIVLMSCKLLGPIPGELLLQILVFLRDARVDRANIRGEVLIRQIGHLLSHLRQVHIKARPLVQTVLGWRLNEEPGADNVTHRAWPRKHHVSKLLFRSQLIKSGLLEELQGNLIQ